MKKIIALILWCSCSLPLLVHAQQYELSPTASRFVSGHDLDSLLFASMEKAGASDQVPAFAIREQLNDAPGQWMPLMQALFNGSVLTIDQQVGNKIPETGTPAYEQIRQRYLLAGHSAAEKLSQTLLASLSFSGGGRDRILHFHSDITVVKNGELRVTETIRIYNGDQGDNPIKRGITRDFPTRYTSAKGLWTNTGFRIISVKKNGSDEPYHTKNLDNGKRILMGSEEVLLDNGIYAYELTYTTNRQLIFHPNKDELYWNVNGTGWSFSADTVSCDIHFPDGAIISEAACYTGPQGSTARECSEGPTGSNTIHFSTQHQLSPYEGLTVAAAIQKGVLAPPGFVANVKDFLFSNWIIPFLLLSVGGLFWVNGRHWFRTGRDPKAGTIIPRFAPPSGLMPAECGYVLDQKYGNHLFAAALVDAAVHRDLNIELEKSGKLFKTTSYRFQKPDNVRNAGRDYGFSLATIYHQTAKSGEYNSSIASANKALQASLEKKFQGKPGQPGVLFNRNQSRIWMGCVWWVISFLLALFFFITHPSLLVAIVCITALLGMLVIQALYIRLINAYTPEGRRVADELLGFKMYLKEAEQPMYNELSPPEKTLTLYEKYLPYAIALKVSTEWSRQFDEMLEQAMATGYQPAYFTTGAHFGTAFHARDFQSGITSGLSSTISAASTPPSSSSGGSSGGGSSGGGGGGGGGGGW